MQQISPANAMLIAEHASQEKRLSGSRWWTLAEGHPSA
jgi:hypothetical protein